MIYVGIDIAAAKHACCILSEDKKVIKQFTFANSASGYEKLRSALLSPAETKIGLESTGVYGNNLVMGTRPTFSTLCSLKRAFKQPL